jgi:hypothetical protein
MPVERFVLDPDTRRARSIVRVTFGPGLDLAPDELAATEEIPTTSGDQILDRQLRILEKYMTTRGWPARTGLYWSNDDGSRWETALTPERPKWATQCVHHPAQLYPERSAERDACDILARCEGLTAAIKAEAPAPKLVDLAIELGVLMGRIKFEAQFGRACDVGIGRILSGGKGGRAYADTKEFERERRLGALRRAIVASPTAGPSAWARTVKELWPDSDDPEGAARKFYERHKDELGHEILMS